MGFKPVLTQEKNTSITGSSKPLLDDISRFIEDARTHVAREYNATQVLLCWFIGKRIDEEILKAERAEYGETIVIALAQELTMLYGRGYSRPNLFRMIKFAKLFPSHEIVSTLSRQLSWSHLILTSGVDDEIKRNFYIEMSRIQRWSVRTLKKQMDAMLYERTTLSKKPQDVIETELAKLKENDELSPTLIFKEPYFIDFIGGKTYELEADLEKLILNNITDFLQELGSDFCFVARQKRMSIGKKDRYLDLKLGDFDPAHKGQMEWYLNWLDRNERLQHEAKPLGIILCAGADKEDIEYLEMDKTGIHVAQYLTELPPKEILEQKLKQAILLARENHFQKQIEQHTTLS